MRLSALRPSLPPLPALTLALSLGAALLLSAPPPAMAQTAADRAAEALQAADDMLGGLGAPDDTATAPTATRAGDAFRVPNYRAALRETVMALSEYAKGRNAGFQIATREGLGLAIKSERDAAIERLADPEAAEGQRAVSPVGFAMRRYVRHLDGVVMNDQYCVPGKAQMTASSAFIDMLQENGLVVLSVDHCPSSEAAIAGWRAARSENVVPHVDTLSGQDALDGLQRVPGGRPLGENPDNVRRLSEARNMLLLDGSKGYADKEALVLDLSQTNHDIVALSPFHRHSDPLTAAQVKALHYKALGARRLVLARLNIGQARDTGYYWQDDWKVGDPEWLLAPVPEDPGLYDVAFWHPDWRAILGRTFAGLMDLGFDGVILEGTEAYAPLEEKTPVE